MFIRIDILASAFFLMLSRFGAFIKIQISQSSLVAQWVKDLTLSLQQLGSLLWCRFDP